MQQIPMVVNSWLDIIKAGPELKMQRQQLLVSTPPPPHLLIAILPPFNWKECLIHGILFTSFFLDEIHGHQFDKRQSFAPCYSQSLRLADFTENHTLVSKIHTKKSTKQKNSSLFMKSIL
jgi:hypothetical protein